ncbi:ParA family protein [Haladaptatus halobius]|uniref:ParA family protein n=1 Tax=Haladaptatus halobius TaxID=2884875 RepID=UPI001D0B9EAE|nr:AAA family ATPase [Haladaptatus halobius]
MTRESRAVALQVLKGGFGKSTIANALSDALARRNNRTLLLDLDPEGHLSTGLGFYNRSTDGLDFRDVLLGESDPSELIEETGYGFDIVPAQNLEAVNKDLSRDEVIRSDEQLKTQFVDPLLEDEYDYIIMDLAGSRNKLTNNALVASRNVIIPLAPAAEALNGIRQTTSKLIGPLREYMNVEILAVVPNDLQQRLDQETTDRELLESMNTSERFAAYLEAGHGADIDAGTLPEGMNTQEVLDAHIPSFARVKEEVWEAIDNGERKPPTIPLRHRAAFTRAYRDRCPISVYDPDCDQLQYFDDLAQIVENGGLQQ